MTALDERPARALPGMDGALHANRPATERVIDYSTYNLTVDVSQQVDYERLAQAILNDADLAWRFRILALNKSNLELRINAGKALRASPAVRQALTITLGPSQAEDLGEDLIELVKEPARCEVLEGDCSNYVEDDKSYEPFSGKHMCAMHLAMAQGD